MRSKREMENFWRDGRGSRVGKGKIRGRIWVLVSGVKLRVLRMEIRYKIHWYVCIMLSYKEVNHFFYLAATFLKNSC